MVDSMRIVFDFTVRCTLGNGSVYIKHKFDGWYRHDSESNSFVKADLSTSTMLESYLGMETSEYRVVEVSEIKEAVVDGTLMRVMPIEKVYPDHPDDTVAECGLMGIDICGNCEQLV